MQKAYDVIGVGRKVGVERGEAQRKKRSTPCRDNGFLLSHHHLQAGSLEPRISLPGGVRHHDPGQGCDDAGRLVDPAPAESTVGPTPRRIREHTRTGDDAAPRRICWPGAWVRVDSHDLQVLGETGDHRRWVRRRCTLAARLDSARRTLRWRQWRAGRPVLCPLGRRLPDARVE